MAAKPKPKPPAKPMVSKLIYLPEDLWELVDEYWHDRRLPSRASAVRALIERGLK